MLRSLHLLFLPLLPVVVTADEATFSPGGLLPVPVALAAARERAALEPSTVPSPDHGTLRVISYNVAALPPAFSRLGPGRMQRIGPLLADYDIVLVQEDFAEPRVLRAAIPLAHASDAYASEGPLDVGDGLSRFSRLPFVEHTRTPWSQCHGFFGDGSDCLARKGFSVATHLLAGDAELDVYNLHLDAGRSLADRAARVAQVDQLLRAIESRSAGRAVLVAGDTNLRSPDRVALRRLLAAELADTCAAVNCGVPGRIDRIFVRSSDQLELSVVRWERLRSFVDDTGRALSDHSPIVAELAWRRIR